MSLSCVPYSTDLSKNRPEAGDPKRGRPFYVSRKDVHRFLRHGTISAHLSVQNAVALVENSPTDYDFREYYVCHSLEELIRHSQKQHQALRPAIEAVVQAHAAWGQPIVIEGWSLDPEWVSQLELPNVKSIWFIAEKALLAHRIRQDEAFYKLS